MALLCVTSCSNIETLTQHQRSVNYVNLARSISQGIGYNVDKEKALIYYEKAAALGNSDALYSVGIAYEEGLANVKQDYNKALYYYELAALQNHAKAYKQLGEIYFSGLGGIDVDCKKAFDYFKKASDLGNPDSTSVIGSWYCDGLCKSTPDYKKAFDYHLKAAEYGARRSFSDLGKMYYNGSGCDTDYEEAKRYLELAVVDNPCLTYGAYFYLGQLYAQGFLGEKNFHKAMEYFLKSVSYDGLNCEIAASLLTLGDYYYYGLGVVKVDHTKSLEYYKKAQVEGSHCRSDHINSRIEKALARCKNPS